MISYIFLTFYLLSLLTGIENRVAYTNNDDNRQDFLNSRDFEDVRNPRGRDNYKNFVERRAFMNYPRLFNDQDVAEFGNIDRDFGSVPNPRGTDRNNNFVESRKSVNYRRHFNDQDTNELGAMEGYATEKRISNYERCETLEKKNCFLDHILGLEWVAEVALKFCGCKLN